jgi:ABC-type multidrug transport system ATPase subunit
VSNIEKIKNISVVGTTSGTVPGEQSFKQRKQTNIQLITMKDETSTVEWASIVNDETTEINDACESIPRNEESKYLTEEQYSSLFQEFESSGQSAGQFVTELNVKDSTSATQLCGTVDELANVTSNSEGERTCQQSVNSFVYDPTNCDPGFWCGCAAPSIFGIGDERCEPSNDTDFTSWVGRYSTTFMLDNNNTEEVVYTGLLNLYPEFMGNYFECPETFYCPGSLSRSVCPGLCPEGYYCPNATIKILCPEGHHCLTGSTQPMKCQGLQRCKGEGRTLPSASIGLLVITVIAVILFGDLMLAYFVLNKSPNNKEDEPNDESNLNDDNDLEDNKEDKRKKMAKSWMDSASMRRSRLTVPKAKNKIDCKFDNLQLTLPNGICIMQGVTGELKAGQFTAIMGPSGAGKSTFLSLLSGKVEPTGGTLKVNGAEASLKEYQKLVGFVPQEDIMLRELTVEENIRHSAFMRLPSELSRKEKKERVYQVMESLDLIRIRNSVIGDEITRGISGGQRKRVNVAMELVADPSLLALDEPTSGLDSTTSTNLCDALSQLAISGVNVLAVIHQPKMEILEMFTNVLLLGVGGRTCYMGPARDMTAYFTRIGFPLPPLENPADYYMDVIAGMVTIENLNHLDFKKEDLFDLWEKAPENPANSENQQQESKDNGKRASIIARDHRTTAGFFGQTYLLSKRALLQRCRVPRNTLIPMLLAVLSGMLAGQLYVNQQPYNGIPSAVVNHPFNAVREYGINVDAFRDPSVQMWMISALIIMLISIKSLESFGRESAVHLRESSSGTGTVSYWLAKTMESAIWIPIHAALFVAFALTFGPLTIHVVDYFFVAWSTLFGYYGIGHCISLIVAPANRALVLLVSILVLIMLFCGFIFKVNDGNEHVFQLFFSFWNAQSFKKAFSKDYEGKFDVKLFNSRLINFNLDFPFWFDILCSFLTAMIWHLISLLILVMKKK